MRFRDLSGAEVVGEVWSPGPAPMSVWVLVEGRAPAAVRLGKAGELPRELDPAHARTPIGVVPVAQWVRLAMRHAPALPAGAWRRAVAEDQPDLWA